MKVCQGFGKAYLGCMVPSPPLRLAEPNIYHLEEEGKAYFEPHAIEISTE